MEWMRQHSGGTPLALLRVWRVLALYRFVDFFAMYSHVTRGFDSQANFIAADFDHHESDRIPDHDFFIFLPAEY